MKKLPRIKLWPITFVLFTLLLLFSFILSPTEVSAAVCTPYPSCHFDINIDVRGYEPVSGFLGLVDFLHDIDLGAPQLSTLIEGNCNPDVTSLYQVYNWPEHPQELVQRPSDLPANLDFATLVGFSTQPGQAILVPNSGYDIGGGYEALVLFATPNQITLQYTPYDGVGVPGYTIHLKNLEIDPALLDCYNQLNQAGRNELPAVLAGEKIGEASGGEILVAIRDTGQFMDPRWRNDWWQRCIPTGGIEFTCKTISVSPPTPSPSPPPPPPPGPCGLSSGAQDSRPDACELCNQTGLFCPSCATSFTVHDTVSYRWHEGTEEEPHCVERSWGGNVTINASGTTIPFVGKKGAEDRQKYLADYFEGICPYYTGKLCPRPENPEEIWTGQAETGVWQWLAPDKKQDELKIKMVERAIGTEPEPIHDYLVTDGTRQRYLSQFKGHFPPKPENYSTYEAWLAAKSAWEKTDWGKLWPYVPMFSREDTPGYIAPYLGWKPLDTPKYIPQEVERVPHLARLYEVTKAIQELLLSLGWIGGSQAQESSPIIASAGENVLGEKILLARVPPGEQIPRGCKFLYGNPDCGCCPDNCNGRVTSFPIPNKMGPLCGWENCEDGTPNFCGTATGPTDPGVCELGGARPVDNCDLNAITDSNPNDTICGPEIAIPLSAVDRFINYNYTPCKWDWVCKCPPSWPEDCPPEIAKCTWELLNPECNNITIESVSRRFSVSLLHPYLTEIWEQTGKTDTNGLFNFFRPALIPEFQEMDAADEIEYSYHGGVTPGTGRFYYNYLGGVQLVKEWIVNVLLNPSMMVAF